MILNETYTLENGLSIPKLGLGTWFIDDDQAAEAVRTAVKLSYRLIDTAQAYGNERGVGEGVRTCGVPREELFVASKVAAELKTYDEAKKSIDETLEKMGLDYLDQMIIHSPQPWNQFRVEKRYSEENKAVWRALEDAQSEGKVRVIGVSNFLRDDLENLLSDCRVKPMVNQILLHISNTDLALLDYCREQAYDTRDIPANAYSGTYLDFRGMMYNKVFGSDNNFYRLEIDYRQYKTVGRRKVIAWTVQSKNAFGDVPLTKYVLSGA